MKKKEERIYDDSVYEDSSKLEMHQQIACNLFVMQSCSAIHLMFHHLVRARGILANIFPTFPFQMLLR
jgi:hypothetical protein